MIQSINWTIRPLKVYQNNICVNFSIRLCRTVGDDIYQVRLDIVDKQFSNISLSYNANSIYLLSHTDTLMNKILFISVSIAGAQSKYSK